MDKYESLSHTKWECKYHVVFYSEVPSKDAVCGIAKAADRSVSGISQAEREQDRRRASDARSRTHAAGDSPEVRCVAGGGVYESEERDLPGEGVWRAETELRWAAFLGEGIFRFHGGSG